MRFLVTIGLGAALFAAAHAQGQAPAPPAAAPAQAPAPAQTPALSPAPVKGATTGFMHAIHATNNVETTLAFYREVFGLDAKVTPFANPGVPLLTNSPGVSLRVAMLRIPGQGFNFELTEFTNTQRRGARPRLTDPGAPHMKFLVRDIATVVAAAKKRRADIITRSNAPVAFLDGVTERIFMRDPDGYIVEVIRFPPPLDAPAANVIGAVMGLTLGNLDASMAFWRDLLGWEFAAAPSWTNDPTIVDLMDLPEGVEARPVRAIVPGSTARIEMIEFRGVKNPTPFDLRVPDPGASGIAIRVANIQELLPKMQAAGIRVISKDGALVEWDAKIRNVFVKDPNGFLVELVGTVAPPAK
jgi:catechol 2,3-dioxygenase-like lactoylglutathione lyase family enzyme